MSYVSESSQVVGEECSREGFASMLEQFLEGTSMEEGSVIKGRIIRHEKNIAIVDIGLKVEGRVPLKEFTGRGREEAHAVGDEVEVYLERVENSLGEAVLSREKARREEAWNQVELSFRKEEDVEGRIFGQVKGGYTVDLRGAVAFLPRSQVDIRPIRDVTPLMQTPQQFRILKMDRRRGNIVVSRRSVLEESHAERRNEIVRNLEEGQIIEGVVKNTTDYGAFVDLGGIDGLLHVTDIAWRRVNHPSDVLSIGEKVQVQVIKINQETHRISLGMKQLSDDPWKRSEERYPVGTKVQGKVTNITDYGAFVELESGIEGLIHVSEMSWTRKSQRPGKILTPGQEIEVLVLEVDSAKHRISLGLKQMVENPWEIFARNNPVGTILESQVRNVADFGLFVSLGEDLDGMVHLSDIDWNQSGSEAVKAYKKDDLVKVVVLDIDVEKERVSLGIKQLSGNPFSEGDFSGIQKDTLVTCEVVGVKEAGLEVRIADTDVVAFIRRSDLSRERSEQNPERFAIGQKVDGMVTQVDKKTRKVSVSIKALEIAEEKETVAQYGSVDSGASLGSILGAALSKAASKKESESEG